uniref:Uncharacterized protein n=1 Tax=Trichogramma kaykai TaxID=54128 RepID=A0ABD2WX43_9HYME
MSRFLSLKLLAIDGSKSRALTRIRAATATGSGSNLVRHFSLGQALGVNLVEPEVVDFNTNPPPERNPNDPRCNDPDDVPSIAVVTFVNTKKYKFQFNL